MIDLVVPYVNNQDLVWRDNFIKTAVRKDYKQIASLHGNRYEDIGLINYNLKLINKNLPWINTIYLLLSNKEQAPSNLPSNVKIVYHYEFIPYRYLPTFNSTTIEMFLWNIPNLSEKFIYINDDMIPTKPLKETDFFDGDKVKINFLEKELTRESTQFNRQCYVSYAHILEKLGISHTNKYICPEHSFTPMLKSHCKESFELIKYKILPEIRPFRKDEQHNQYIYPIYEHYKYGTLPSEIKFFYSHLNEEDFENQLKSCDIVCPNVLVCKENITILVNYLEKLCE